MSRPICWNSASLVAVESLTRPLIDTSSRCPRASAPLSTPIPAMLFHSSRLAKRSLASERPSETTSMTRFRSRDQWHPKKCETPTNGRRATSLSKG
jgi:hypothetical protein